MRTLLGRIGVVVLLGVGMTLAGCSAANQITPAEILDRVDASVECGLGLATSAGAGAAAVKGLDTKNFSAVLGAVNKIGTANLPQDAAKACSRIIKYGIDDAKRLHDSTKGKPVTMGDGMNDAAGGKIVLVLLASAGATPMAYDCSPPCFVALSGASKPGMDQPRPRYTARA